jgi:hypothetical protein
MYIELLAERATTPGSEDNRAPAYRAFLTFLTILVTIIIGLRFWSRSLIATQQSGRVLPRFWWDDWVALFAVVCFPPLWATNPSFKALKLT